MQLLLLLLFLPLFVPIVAKKWFKSTFPLWSMFLTSGITSLVVLGIFFAGTHSKSSDVEIWNGYVVKKIMKQQDCPSGWRTYRDEFCSEYKTREVYSHTSCTTDSEGNTSCTDYYDTEYKYEFDWERRWYVNTSLGQFQINRVDNQGAVEPPRYQSVQLNDPVSQEHTFVNWVKAVPESLFNNSDIGSHAYTDQIPSYPQVYDYYKLNRVLSVGEVTIPEDLNFELGKMLGRVNPHHQVNVIVIVTNIPDPSYRHAVELSWIGGKKNDVVIFLSIDKNGDFIWTDVMTWARGAGNGIFVVTLKDHLHSIGNINQVGNIVLATEQTIKERYDRPSNSDHEHLKHAIVPPTWVIATGFIVQILLLAGMILFFVYKAPRRRY